MDAALLDVLEHRTHVAALAVGERIHVELNSVLEEGVEVDGAVGRDERCLRHIRHEVLVVVDDRHAAAAQHVARPHDEGIPHAARHLLGLLERRGRRAGRIGDLQAVEQGGETVAVLGEIDGLGLRAHDGDAGRLEPPRQVDGGLPAQRHDHAHGPLDLDDVHDILEGERLEVQPVARVVVGGDGLGVAVHHDGLEPRRLQRVRRVAAAVVELDALADAVGTSGEDHHAGLGRLVPLRRPAALVGEVVVAAASRSGTRAGVDGLHERTHAQHAADGAHDIFRRTRELRDLRIRESQLLGREQVRSIESRDPARCDGTLGSDDVGDAAEEPRVDGRGLVHTFHGPAAPQGLGHIEDALGRWRRHELVEPLLIVGIVRAGAQPGIALLERAHGLLERLLEGGADAHDLADRLHARGEGGVGALELLECEARNLHHDVVDRGVGVHGAAGDEVVLELIEGVAHGEQRGHLGDGESRGLARQR